MRILFGLMFSFSLLIARPTFAQTLDADLHPNSEKYAERASSKAHGRSGSAELDGRALLGKNGATEVELTTGELDSDTPTRGYISRVQLKAQDSTGGTAFVDNYTHLSVGGYFAVQANHFRRGQP